MSKLTLIIGGARSGKSMFAERLATRKHTEVLYIATGQPLDEEMRARIAAHRQRRPVEWQTLELPADVGRQLLARRPRAQVILLDCVTLLVSNLMLGAASDVDNPDEAAALAALGAVEAEIAALIQGIDSIPAHWLIVTNEVGQGVVPAYPAGRLFRDLLGWANQKIAEKADEVYWMVAGIPVPIGEHKRK